MPIVLFTVPVPMLVPASVMVIVPVLVIMPVMSVVSTIMAGGMLVVMVAMTLQGFPVQPVVVATIMMTVMSIASEVIPEIPRGVAIVVVQVDAEMTVMSPGCSRHAEA